VSADLATRLFVSPLRSGASLARRPLPPAPPPARRTVLDLSEFFGETSGGVRTYLTEKARYVERSGDLRQTILLPGPRDSVNETERVRCYRLGGLTVPTQAPYRFLLDARAIRRIVRHERPDVIEVGSPGLAPWHVEAVSRRLGIPLVSFFHSHVPRLIAGSATPTPAARRISASLAWRYFRRLDRMFARTIVASRFTATELAHAGIERTAYVPLGVDLDHFHPRRREHAAKVRARLGVGDRPLVVFAGRIAGEKRLDLLLRAWPRVAQRTGAVLVLAGEGPLRRMLQHRHSQSDVRWLGYLTHRGQLADLLAVADVCVSPGEIETFGLATLEALASGTPVVAADLGGGAELVTNSGGGVLFAHGDPSSLGDGIEAMLAAGRDTVGTRGRLYAERHHAWADMFQAVFRLYDEIVSERA
jgi:alpha-1,6-mannosyltransferase